MRNINGEYNSSWSKGHVYYKERQKRKHKAINLKMQINENTLLWHIPKQHKYALLDT